MFEFNSQNKKFKTPQGAIRQYEEVILNIHIKHSCSCRPSVVIEKRQDYDKFFYKECKMQWIFAEGVYDIYRAVFKIEDIGNFYYHFDIKDKEDDQISRELYELLVYDENYQVPAWIKGGLIYHIFVDRFFKNKILKKRKDVIIQDDWSAEPEYKPNEDGEVMNNDFFGGNLDGIRSKLPYLKSLGVSIIYLSPIFEAYSNHKYDTANYLKIDPMFGTDKTLESLCKKADDLGISIIIDGVFNHTGANSVYFNKNRKYKSVGACQSKESPYFGWYEFQNWNTEYNCWWGIKTLPAVNKNDQSYIDFITGENGVLKYWLNKGVKGYRLDVADELPNEFLEKINKAIKSEKEDALIVGEVWEYGSNKFAYSKLKEYFCGKQLDSVTNYPLKDAIINYLIMGDCSNLYETMNFITDNYPHDTINCIMNILGTHDTARILTELGSSEKPLTKDEMAVCVLSPEEKLKGIKKLKLASLLQMTLPGVPCIYYGDEVGMEGWKDPFNRRGYPWGSENQEILDHYMLLSKLRKSNDVFVEGKYRCLVHDEGAFVFQRYTDDKSVIIALNASDTAITINAGNLHTVDSWQYLIIDQNLSHCDGVLSYIES